MSDPQEPFASDPGPTAETGTEAVIGHGVQRRRHEHDHDHVHDHGHEHEHRGGLAGWLRAVFRPHSHDSADSVDAAVEGSAEGVRAVKISLAGLGVTVVLQAGLVVLTGSVALL